MDGPSPNAPEPNAPSAPERAAPDPIAPDSPATDSPAPIPAPDLPAPDAPSATSAPDLTAARKRARARNDPFAHRRGEPRTFAILWMAYMVTAILISLAPVGASGMLSVETYRPSARLLAALMAMGIAVIWPMVRLSQVRPRSPIRAVAQDQVIVMVPVTAMCAAQAAPWMAGWPANAGACMALGLFGWSIFIAGVLLHAFAAEARRDPAPVSPASARELDHGVNRPPIASIRVVAMLLLMVISIAGPLVSAQAYDPESSVRGWDGIRVDWGLMSSPVGFALEVARDRVWTGRAAAISGAHWWGVAGIFALGLLSIATGRARLRRAARPPS